MMPITSIFVKFFTFLLLLHVIPIYANILISRFVVDVVLVFVFNFLLSGVYMHACIAPSFPTAAAVLWNVVLSRACMMYV